MIEVQSLTKRYGRQTVVDDLSFCAAPGVITGFLGPNGAGKSTTMRMIVGLDIPDHGSALINGKPHRRLSAPLRQVGALLDARAVHPGRSARAHLTAIAQTHGIPTARVAEVISMVGLADVAGRRAGTFSLGMSQRLGIAGALLGDPDTLILDEPVNGLDAEGIHWIRTLLQRLAREGRTILLSSHLMSEMAQTAERLIVVGAGRLLADTSVDDLLAEASQDADVFVRSPQARELAMALGRVGGVTVTPADDPDAVTVTGVPSPRIGELAAEHGLTLHELAPRHVSLEDAYLRLTEDSVQYHAESGHDRPAPTPEPLLEAAA